MQRWRVIRDGPLPGDVNMARDAALLAAHRVEDDPVLRLYRWQPPAVSIGYHQEPAAFDGEAIAALGANFVQRPTGGRAILHADELTYAVVGASPSTLFGDSLHASYLAINRALLLFLYKLGITADISAGESRESQRSLVCFHSAGQHEILVAGRKLVGSAQRRSGEVFLQHGSILTGPGHAALVDCLPATARGDATREQLAAATTDLGQLLQRPIDEAQHARLVELLIEAFSESFGLPWCES